MTIIKFRKGGIRAEKVGLFISIGKGIAPAIQMLCDVKSQREHMMKDLGNLRGFNRLSLPASALACGLMLSASISPAIAQETSTVDDELRNLVPQAILDAGTIVAAGTFDYPPSLYVDVNDPTIALGVAPDISHAIGALLGVEFEWQNVEWPGQIPGLESGAYDVLWGQISVTAQRERELLDLIPWAERALGWLVPEGNPLGLSGWESACGQRVGVVLGAIFVSVLNTASDTYCADNDLPAIEVLEYQTSELPALESGQVDAVIDSLTVMQRVASSRNGIFEAVPLPEQESFELYPGLAGIAINKAQPGLSTAIAAALQSLYASGELEAIFAAHDATADTPREEVLRVNYLTDTPAGEIAE